MSRLLASLLYGGLLRSPPDDPAAGGGGPSPSAGDPSPSNLAPSPGAQAAPDPSAPSGQASAPAVAEADLKLPDSLLGAYDGDKKVPALAPEAGKEAATTEGDKKPAVVEGDAKPPVEAKKDPAAPPAEVKKEAEPAKLAEPAPIVPIDPVLYGEILLPGEVGEGPNLLKVTANPAMMTEFTATLGKFGVAKEAAQPLADLHVKAMTNFANEQRAQQYRDYAEVINGWTKESMADKQIGGSGFQTSMAAIARMRERFVSRAAVGTDAYSADMKAFNDMLNTTGVGSHPAFLKFIHNFARMFDEPQIPPHIGQPPKGNGQRPVRNFRDAYDHPRSDPAKRQ